MGTTATKAMLFDLEGHPLASATRPYVLLTPQPGWVEQEPEALWQAVVEAIREVLAQAPEGRVVALCQTSQGGTLLPLDAQGQPLYRAISWMDQRAGQESQRAQETWGADWIKRITGWGLGNGLPLLEIAWLREHRPDVSAAAAHYAFVNDFITLRLTGRRVMNPSDAGITQLMDIEAGDWDERLLAFAGIRREQLSPLAESGTPVGTLTTEASAATGLPQDVLVVNGAHDQYCAAVGTGVLAPGPVMLSCGTAWVLLAVPESLELGRRSGMSISRHAVPGQWGAIRSLGGVGASLEWLLRQWGTDYEAINAGAARSAPGANGCFFAPLAGGHTSGANQGGFWGLALAHTRDDLARAVMEGIAYELRWALEENRAAGLALTELVMVGGAARSPVWPGIVAEVTGLPVVLPAVHEAASRGAAILAGVGAGCFQDAAAGFRAMRGDQTRLEPDAARCRVYDDLFACYRRIRGEG